VKRYLLFAGTSYCARGGWGDFQGSFDSEFEAQRTLRFPKGPEDWYHIVDIESGKKIASSSWFG